MCMPNSNACNKLPKLLPRHKKIASPANQLLQFYNLKQILLASLVIPCSLLMQMIISFLGCLLWRRGLLKVEFAQLLLSTEYSYLKLKLLKHEDTGMQRSVHYTIVYSLKFSMQENSCTLLIILLLIVNLLQDQRKKVYFKITFLSIPLELEV